jgi:uncharacterized protein
MKPERRFLSDPVEFRAGGEGAEPQIRGYAALYNSRSENLGGKEHPFYEVIEPGAFDEVLKDDVRALFNHDANLILARSRGGKGTLRLFTDERGLGYEFTPADTSAGRDLRVSVERGDVDQSSFAFTVAEDGDKWVEEGGVITRTIKKVARLFDVSPVTYPAYPDTAVALRSLETFQQEQRQEAEPTPPPPEPTKADYDWERRLRILQLGSF